MPDFYQINLGLMRTIHKDSKSLNPVWAKFLTETRFMHESTIVYVVDGAPSLPGQPAKEPS